MRILLSTLLILALASMTLAAGPTKVSWDANSEPDLAGYRVYVNGVVVGETTDTTFPLPANSEGDVWVTAVDTSGNESDPSNTVNFDSQPPKPPGALRLN